MEGFRPRAQAFWACSGGARPLRIRHDLRGRGPIVPSPKRCDGVRKSDFGTLFEEGEGRFGNIAASRRVVDVTLQVKWMGRSDDDGGRSGKRRSHPHQKTLRLEGLIRDASEFGREPGSSRGLWPGACISSDLYQHDGA